MTCVSIGPRGMGVDVDDEFGNCRARGMGFDKLLEGEGGVKR
jgi:hypothetical protein